MKAKSKNIILCLGLLLGAGLTGCQDSYNAPELQVPVATMEANTTIAELKTLFGDEVAVQAPYLDEDKQIPYVIKGRVISSDASGNIYRSLVVQDRTAAIAISINRGSLYTSYPLGQEVVINVTGLWIGQYNNLIQLGWLGDYQGNPQISFMSYDLFANHTQKSGLPEKTFKYIGFGKEAPVKDPYIIVSSLEEISSIAGAGEEYRNMMSQLVEIPNVAFVDGGKATFAPYQDNADRYIQDVANPSLQLNVRCSGYSSFYNDTVPTGTGTVRGILSRYGDNWQLLLRDKNDVIFDTKGSKDNPYSTEEVIAQKCNGRTAWAEGYIIGSVRGGVAEVTSTKDIIFNVASTELENNVVIAPTADCRDFDKMVIVELPAATKIREYANLLDNPQVMGHKLIVRGSFNEWLGMNGITDTPGSVTDFEIEGIEISGVSGQGSGTEDSPYLVGFIIANPETQTDVWVEGYIVGYISGSDFYSGATFSVNTDGADYSGNNVIIAASPDANSTAVAIPVALSGAARREFSLKSHPENYKKLVKIRGNIGETFKATGISAVSAMAVKK